MSELYYFGGIFLSMTLKNTEIVRIMNEYGSKRIPFLFIVDFEGKMGEILSHSEATEQGIEFQTINYQNFENKAEPNLEFYFKKNPINYEVYKTAFNKVLHEIKIGNSYLVNLTFPTKIETNLDLPAIFYRSTAKFKLLYPEKFVCFSPEIFVIIHDGIISSYPMKGTIDANIENAEIQILNNLKEKAEHNTIVDLIRNDLSRVATNVRLEKFRYIEKIETNQKNLLQVSSHISGDLPSDYKEHIGEIIFNLLPAGSISGAPKTKTLEIIKEAEIDSRSYYTGVFGYFDGNNLESGVLIRFIEKSKDGLVFRSGGGITFMSDSESEYNELIDKVYVPFI